jgi:hypothetical protein
MVGQGEQRYIFFETRSASLNKMGKRTRRLPVFSFPSRIARTLTTA